MYVHPELQSALIAQRQAEIRREVRGEHGIRQEWHERSAAAGPRGLRSLAGWLEIRLIHRRLGPKPLVTTL